jgi:hypothetical protein
MIDRRVPSGPVAVLPLKPSAEGGSGAFLVRCDDGNRYWCKVSNNGQSIRVPVTEQIIGRLGRLVGVATCDVSLVWIPDELAGWEYRPGRRLEPGWAHGSSDIEPVTPSWQLDHRPNDDNQRRHAGFFALYDWLYGDDAQWLVRVPADWMFFSHDHGYYLPGSPDWTIESLQSVGDAERALEQDRSNLDPLEMLRMASQLEGLTEEDIGQALDDLPQEWISDDELEEVVRFARRRGVAVASRLRTSYGT